MYLTKYFWDCFCNLAKSILFLGKWFDLSPCLNKAHVQITSTIIFIVQVGSNWIVQNNCLNHIFLGHCVWILNIFIITVSTTFRFSDFMLWSFHYSLVIDFVPWWVTLIEWNGGIWFINWAFIWLNKIVWCYLEESTHWMLYVVMGYDSFCCWYFLMLIWCVVWLDMGFTSDEVLSFMGSNFKATWVYFD